MDPSVIKVPSVITFGPKRNKSPIRNNILNPSVIKVVSVITFGPSSACLNLLIISASFWSSYIEILTWHHYDPKDGQFPIDREGLGKRSTGTRQSSSNNDYGGTEKDIYKTNFLLNSILFTLALLNFHTKVQIRRFHPLDV